MERQRSKGIHANGCGDNQDRKDDIEDHTPLIGKAVILPIDVRDVDFYWPFIVGFIERALEHTDNEISLEDIYADIANQERQLWIIKQNNQYIATVITRIYSYKGGLKVGEVSIAGGSDHNEWDHFTDVVGVWFKEKGCDFIDIIGRSGWQRLYKNRGFKTAYVQLRKPL